MSINPSSAKVCHWLDREEEDLLAAFREFKEKTPIGSEFRALTMTTEEESVLFNFRRFKERLHFAGTFKWRTSPIKQSPVCEVKPELVTIS